MSPLDVYNLGHFTGSMMLTRLPVLGRWPEMPYAEHPTPFATDGAMYVLENGGAHGAFWLWDMIASHIQTNAALQKEDFLFIRLTVLPKDEPLDPAYMRSVQAVLDHKNGVERKKKPMAIFQIDNGLEEDDDAFVKAVQEIEYTDFDLPEIKLYFKGNVLLLPSEY